MRKALEGVGHAVLEAKDGDAALLVAKHHAGPIDVVVIDLGLPRLVATAVAELIERTRRVKTLYISGPIGASPIPGEPVIRKPFTDDELVESVKALTV